MAVGLVEIQDTISTYARENKEFDLGSFLLSIQSARYKLLACTHSLEDFKRIDSQNISTRDTIVTASEVSKLVYANSVNLSLEESIVLAVKSGDSFLMEAKSALDCIAYAIVKLYALSITEKEDLYFTKLKGKFDESGNKADIVSLISKVATDVWYIDLNELRRLTSHQSLIIKNYELKGESTYLGVKTIGNIKFFHPTKPNESLITTFERINNGLIDFFTIVYYLINIDLDNSKSVPIIIN